MEEKHEILSIASFIYFSILNFNRFYVTYRSLSRFLVMCHRYWNTLDCTTCKNSRVVAYRREKRRRYCTPVMTSQNEKKEKENNSLTLLSARVSPIVRAFVLFAENLRVSIVTRICESRVRSQRYGTRDFVRRTWRKTRDGPKIFSITCPIYIFDYIFEDIKLIAISLHFLRRYFLSGGYGCTQCFVFSVSLLTESSKRHDCIYF